MQTSSITPRPMPVPAASRGGAGKVILIVLAVIFALALIVVSIFGYFVWRVSKAMHADKNGRVTISTPEGNFSAGANKTYTAAELGVDPYPGATTSTGGFDMSSAKGSVVTAVYETSDAADKVASFYKSQTGAGEQTVTESGTNSVITFKKSEKEVVVVTIKANSLSDGKTQLTIVHSTQK